MTIRLAIFDCDGTLSDGQAAVCIAMEQAFSEAGLAAPDRHNVRRIVGLSLPQAISQLAPDAPDQQREHAVDAYKQNFRRARLEGSLQEPMFEGMPELLVRLHDAGWTLGVATGKSDRGLKSTLAVHGLSHLFTTLQTADRHPSKPHPSMAMAAMDEALAAPANTVMIGDTVFDMELARSARIRALGVDWGYHDTQELLDAGAEQVARTPAELGDMLNG